MARYSRCLLILADGARPDLFQQLLQDGELPAIQEHLVSRGGFSTATTAFPSTTGPAYMPFLNGCYPGTCHVPGIRWFDKDVYARKKISRRRFRSYVGFESYLMNHDMATGTPTLFEMMPRSASIFNPVNRGVSFHGNRSKFWRIWYWYYAHLTDHWMLVDQAAHDKSLQAMADGSEFVFVVFPGIDEYSHIADPFHEMTIEAYRHVDRTVRDVAMLLKKRGWYEETLIMIVSDHGLSSTHTHFGLGHFLEETGRKTFYYPKIFKRNFQVASMVSGNGMGHLYFRGTRGWEGRLRYDEIQAVAGDVVQGLLKEAAVDLLICEDGPGAWRVLSQRGMGLVREAGDKIHYQVLDRDPFGYGPLPQVMSEAEVLQRTMGTDYPDALVQIRQIFKSARTGDLVVSARRGYDLRRRFEVPEHKASHGSLDREHMAIPLCTNLPLPGRPLRSVDVFPTISEALGYPVPAGIDGRSFLTSR